MSKLKEIFKWYFKKSYDVSAKQIFQFFSSQNSFSKCIFRTCDPTYILPGIAVASKHVWCLLLSYSSAPPCLKPSSYTYQMHCLSQMIFWKIYLENLSLPHAACLMIAFIFTTGNYIFSNYKFIQCFEYCL